MFQVLIPGLDDDDQRVKICSLDDSQQGILDSFKSKVTKYFFWKTAIEFRFEKHLRTNKMYRKIR